MEHEIPYFLGEGDLVALRLAELRGRRRMLVFFVYFTMKSLLFAAVWGVLVTFGTGLALPWAVVASALLILSIATPGRSWARSMLRPRPQGKGTVSTWSGGELGLGTGKVSVLADRFMAEDEARTVEVPWSNLSVADAPGGVIFATKRPSRAALAFVPAKTFVDLGQRSHLVRRCLDRAAGVQGTVGVIPPHSSLTYGFVRGFGDLAAPLPRELSRDNQLLLGTLLSPLVVPFLLALTLMPLLGGDAVAVILGTFLAVLGLAVLLRGRVGAAAAIARKRLRRRLRDIDFAAGTLGQTEYRLGEGGIVVSAPVAGVKLSVSWRAVTNCDGTEAGVFIDGVKDLVGMPLFIPHRAFAGLAAQDDAVRFIRGAAGAARGAVGK